WAAPSSTQRRPFLILGACVRIAPGALIGLPSSLQRWSGRGGSSSWRDLRLSLARQFLGRRRIPYVAGQRLEERHQILLLLRGQMEGLDLLREIGVGTPAAVVEIDDFPERLLATVVHVGRRLGDVPQSGSLELAAV